MARPALHHTGAGHAKQARRQLHISLRDRKGFVGEWRAEWRINSESGGIPGWPPVGRRQQKQQQPTRMPSELAKATRTSSGLILPTRLGLEAKASSPPSSSPSASDVASPCPCEWLDPATRLAILRNSPAPARSRDPARCKSTTSWPSPGPSSSSSSSSSSSRLSSSSSSSSSPNLKLRHLEEELRSKLDIDTATSEHWDPFHDRDEGLVLLNASGGKSTSHLLRKATPVMEISSTDSPSEYEV
jgi:hypothetical protein